MYINITELFSQTVNDVQVDRQLPYEEVAFGGELYSIKDPISVSMSLKKLDDHDYLAKGTIKTTLVIPCNRCTVDVRYTIETDFEKDLEIGSDSEETGEYLEDSKLNLEKMVLDEVYMHIPMKVLCKEDCLGICKSCGQNLNEAACDCEDDNVDPRLAGLKELFNDRFKEV